MKRKKQVTWTIPGKALESRQFNGLERERENESWDFLYDIGKGTYLRRLSLTCKDKFQNWVETEHDR